MGGLGFLHYNMTIDEQVAHAKAVKNHQSGALINPVILSPRSTVKQLKDAMVSTSMLSDPV